MKNTIKKYLYLGVMCAVVLVTVGQVATAGINNPLSTAPSISATSATATSTFAGGVTMATSGGNVGIGTSTPNARLDVYNSNTSGASEIIVRSAQTANQQARVRFFSNNTSDRGYVGFDQSNSTRSGIHLWNADNTALIFGTNNVEFMRAMNVGEVAVGIGTTTARAMFQVTSRNVNATTSMQVGKPGQNKGTCITEYDTAGSPVYRFFAAGATSPTYQNGGTAPSGCIN